MGSEVQEGGVGHGVKCGVEAWGGEESVGRKPGVRAGVCGDVGCQWGLGELSVRFGVPAGAWGPG